MPSTQLRQPKKNRRRQLPPRPRRRQSRKPILLRSRPTTLFHGTRRCPSCMKIEAYSQEAVQTGFAEDLKAGKMEWLVINTDESPNEHYEKDYQLYTKSLILSRVENGKETKWKNLEKVWELLGDKEAFIKYVQDEVRLMAQDK
jgi:hypothetical protein